MRGPTAQTQHPHASFPQFRDLELMYHQQTKNLLVSYSPKKLGFF
ncbi:hypothetical protein [Streptomyces seoulensis]|nr:hypothetical protein [Streptomyces seoulensis]